jgi:putative endonuclease
VIGRAKSAANLRQARGLASRGVGRRAETLAALLLMVKGYRIIGFRVPCRLGEVDIVAVRGDVLAIVEVKQRTSLETALQAVTREQRDRLRRAGRQIGAGTPRLSALSVRLDLIAIARGGWPRHIPDAWPLAPGEG